MNKIPKTPSILIKSIIIAGFLVVLVGGGYWYQASQGDGGDVPSVGREPPSLRSYSSRSSRDSTVRLIQVATSFARLSNDCEKGHKEACASLNADGGKARTSLAHFQAELEKTCDQSDIRSCMALGDIKKIGGDPSGSKKAFEKAKGIVETTQVRCLRGDEPSPVACKRAPQVLKAIETRANRVVSQ